MIKDYTIRDGIGNLEFDIFGIAEVNVNWAQVSGADRLVHQSKHSWEGSQFMFANNIHSTNSPTQPFGGVAM